MQKMPGQNPKYSLLFVGLIVLFVNFFGFVAFLKPAPAHAQWTVTVIEDINAVRKEIEDSIAESLTAAALNSLMQGASYFARKLAYDSATYIASGGKGQGALAFEDGFDKYLEDVAADSLATTISELGAPFGLNLCGIPDAQFQVQLQLSLGSLYGEPEDGPQPTCRWETLENTLFSADAWEAKYGGGSEQFMSRFFDASLNVRDSDFGIAMNSIAKVDRIRQEQKDAKIYERQEGDGFKAVTDLISGEVKTPSQVVKKETEALTAAHQGQLSSEQVAGIYGSGALQILPMAASVFLNTLTSQLLNQLLSGGLFPSGGGQSEEQTGSAFDFYASANANRIAAQTAFNFLLAATPGRLDTYDIVSEFHACPAGVANVKINNCVIDDDFQTAITRSTFSEPLTIQEALDEGLLHADWPLIPPSNKTLNSSFDCRNQAYCYSNLQKLRKARIVPLGFEIAALRADPDVQEEWTLGKVVAGFEDCLRDTNGDVVYTPSKKYCHLIDPNWIIKAPEAQCRTLALGSQLVSPQGPNRMQECLDLTTCVQHDEDGNCISHSFCTREENVWRFPGEACEPHFATCKTFTGVDGSINSYLSRTLDFGTCTADSVGCRAYSTAQDQFGNWIPSASAALASVKQFGTEEAIYFNENVVSQTCSANNEGCHAYYPATFGGVDDDGVSVYVKETLPIYFKKAPDYLGCYDADPGTLGVQWPESKSDLPLIEGAERCSDFVGACVEEEVACELYTQVEDGAPVQNKPQVPGIIGANSCEVECVGYDAFKQEGSPLDTEEYPVYFVPSQAQECSGAHVGCSEFTNLDAAAQGGESLEYYSDLDYCEVPDGQNEKTFYSWKGSVNQGYVLQVHKFRPVLETDTYLTALDANDGAGTYTELLAAFPEGSPAYANDRPQVLLTYFEQCNQENYNILINDPFNPDAANDDCRAFYDDDGDVFYRLLDKTVTVSEACHPLRITEPSFYEETALNGNAGLCEAVGGELQGNSCQRCLNGGFLENGACIYWTISLPGESNSCPAVANGCRAFTGNAAGNVQELFTDSFEPVGVGPEALVDAQVGWSQSNAVSIVGESIHVGLHSLQVNTGILSVSRNLPATTNGTDAIFGGEWYELTFWTRGEQQDIVISFEQDTDAGTSETFGSFTYDPLTDSTIPVQIGNTWQQVTLGPIQFTGSSLSPARLQFARVDASSGVFYLDNVQLTHVENSLTVIKDSWKQPLTVDGETFLADVPLSCDSTPLDPFPGEALGCRAYEDSEGNPTQATGFEQLCREEAIGCRAVYDSQNTLDTEDISLYNVWCEAEGGTFCEVGFDLETIGSCSVPFGADGCFVDHVVLPGDKSLEDFEAENPNAFLYEKPSTIIRQADTPLSDPIFITAREEYRCPEGQLGCQLVGLQEQVLPDETAASYEFTETYVRANPDNFVGPGGILCTDEQVGCSQYASGNNTFFFKDPVVTGNTLCEYVPDADDGASGWYLSDIGTCSDNPNLFCSEDADCGDSGSCTQVGEVPCYDNFQSPGPNYGIWSNGDANYAGHVGLCAPEQNGCTEFVDPADSSELNPDGTPYYVLFDSRVTARIQECDAKAGLEHGCVLFNQTEVPEKLFNAEATYAESQAQIELTGNIDDGLVAPVAASPGAPGNANIILKVDRDRQCSEWLDCQAAFEDDDENGNELDICYDYRACLEGDGSGCTRFLDAAQIPHSEKFLDIEKYVKRPTGWYDNEYSGYSLFDSYQITDLYPYSFTPEDSTSTYHFLAYRLNEALNTGLPECVGPTGLLLPDWTSCGPDDGGSCLQGECIYPASGSTIEAAPDQIDGPDGDVSLAIDHLNTVSCKVHPEADSPYPLAYANQAPYIGSGDDPTANEYFPGFRRFVEKRAGFEGANICQTEDCRACSYGKVQYSGGVTAYWGSVQQGTESFNIPGTCVGGTKSGNQCTEDEHCGDPTQAEIDANIVPRCQKAEVLQKSTHFGIDGYCLEEDRSRPIPGGGGFECLTWMPIDVNATGVDNYNLVEEAGFSSQLDIAGTWSGTYCLEATGSSVYTDFPTMNVMYEKQFGQIGYAFNFSEDEFYTPEASSVEDIYFFGTSQNDSDEQLERIPRCFDKQVEEPPMNGEYECTPSSDCGSGTHVSGYPIVACNWAADSSSGFNTIHTDGDFDEIVGEEAQKGWYLFNFMQGFARRELSPNAIVLRTEAGDYHENIGADPVSTADGEVANPYTLLPLAESYAEFGGGAETLGIIHHPVRSFNNFYGDEFLIPTPAELGQGDSGDDNNLVNSMHAAPGPYTLGPEGAYDALVRSPYEATMRLQDLRSIHFIPTLFPGGVEGDAPNLLEKEIILDIEELLEDDDGVMIRSVVSENCGENKSLAYCLGSETLGVLNYVVDADEQTIEDYANTPVLPERSRIDKRFVVAFFDINKQLTWLPEGFDVDNPLKPEFDLFDTNYVVYEDDDQDDVWESQLPCPSNGDQGEWSAIAMDFNSDGEFLGYASRHCSDNGGQHGINLAIIADVYPQCTHFVRAIDDNDESKAWTNRVWNAGTKQIQSSIPGIAFDGSPTEKDGFIDPFPNHPYGSLRNQAPGQSGGLTGFGTEGQVFENIQKYNFVTSDGDGMPFYCSSPLMKGYSLGAIASSFCATLSEYLGPTKSYEQTTLGNVITFQNFTEEDRHLIFYRLFAKSYGILERVDEWLGFYEPENWLTEGSSATQGIDRSADVTLQGRVPRVYSINPARCEEDSGTCGVGEVDNFTISGRNGVAKDYDNDGFVDENPECQAGDPDCSVNWHIGEGTFLARAEFFFTADDNHLPVRRVMVDWDDGFIFNDSPVATGKYQNHKPYCTSGGLSSMCRKGTEEVSLLTCVTDADCPAEEGYVCWVPESLPNADPANNEDSFKEPRFGNDETRACNPEPFVVTRVYSCPESVALVRGTTVADIEDISQRNRVKAKGYGDSQPICIFEPQVQILDNWGWCNGSCNPIAGNVHTDGGCYDYKEFAQCSNQVDDSWTPYSGKVIVIPQ